jgi:carbon storage regulator
MEVTLMLVLSRKLGESIILDGTIKVTVVAVDRNKVRIGIEAPPEVPVHREEIFRAIQQFAEPELVGAN